MTEQIILTEDGKKKMEQELKELISVKRPEVIDKIAQAKELGDLSENAEYHDAKDQQGLIETRISELEEILKKAVINSGSIEAGIVGMGSKIIVADSLGKNKEFILVGFNEADPLVGKISNESPLGKAFMGKKLGEKVFVEIPKGKIEYKIVSIS